MNKQTKVIYIMFLIGIFILWISSIALLRAQIGVSVTKYFVQLLSFMLIACLLDFVYKVRNKIEKAEDFSVTTPALGIVSCFLYLAYLGFWLGRFIARSVF